MQELGLELKQMREQKGLTLSQVQTDTKIRSRYLEAIEQGDLASLPGLVYARGFIKSYAEYLGMNGQELLERYELVQPAATQNVPTELPRRSAKHSAPVDASKPSLGNSRLLPQIIAGVGVVAVLVAAYVLLVNRNDPSPQVPNDNAKTQATNNPQDTTPTAQQPPVAPPEPPKPQVTVTQTAKEANSTLYSVAGVENLTLELSAQDKCWVEVKVDGKVIESGIVNAGETRTWSGTKDIAVLTGNSKSITLKANDQSVAFEPQLRGYTYQFQKI